MADATDPLSAATELHAHRRTFESFGRLILFAILHIGLTLTCLAFAFLAHVPLIAFVAWIGGTLAMIAVFTFTANYGAER